MVGSYVPDRGDVVFLDFNPQSGHEQAGHRPAIILSPRAYNQLTRLALVAPITSRQKSYPFEVKLPEDLAIQGVVLSDQLKSLDWSARRASFRCKAPDAVIDEVLAKLNTLLSR